VKPGTRVRHPGTGEVGIVVHSWHDQDIDAEDNYIAFFGREFPDAEPDRIPYILRYATVGLEIVGEAT
jgi:hypothetical protein